MSDGNQLPPAGEPTACPTSFAKPLIQQGGAGGFACRSHGHNQWSASKLNKFPKTVMHPAAPEQPALRGARTPACRVETLLDAWSARMTRTPRQRVEHVSR